MKSKNLLIKIQKLSNNYENVIFWNGNTKELYFYNGNDMYTDDNESLNLKEIR